MPLTPDQHEVLRWFYDLVQRGRWVTLDTETTGLGVRDQVISWAICVPSENGGDLIIHEGKIKPTVPIGSGAKAIHGISEEHLQNAPSFASVVPIIQEHLAGIEDVIIYNADFDTKIIGNSAYAYGLPRDVFGLHERTHCAMKRYAEFRAEIGRYGDYKWHKLIDACQQLGLDSSYTTFHGAAADARMTALLVQKLAEMARAELSDL